MAPTVCQAWSHCVLMLSRPALALCGLIAYQFSLTRIQISLFLFSGPLCYLMVSPDLANPCGFYYICFGAASPTLYKFSFRYCQLRVRNGFLYHGDLHIVGRLFVLSFMLCPFLRASYSLLLYWSVVHLLCAFLLFSFGGFVLRPPNSALYFFYVVCRPLALQSSGLRYLVLETRRLPVCSPWPHCIIYFLVYHHL